MYRSNSSASDGHRQPPLDTHPRNYNNAVPPFRCPPHQQHRWKPQFYPHYRDWPYFIVQLRSDAQRVVEGADIDAVIEKLKFKHQKSNVVASNFTLAAFFFNEQWSEALETVVQLWEIKLSDERQFFFLPRVVSNIAVPSDKLELNDRLKVLFLERLRGLKEGNLVAKWWEKLGAVVEEIKRVSHSLTRRQRLGVADELLRKRKGLEAEGDLILNRVREFKSGIKCIESYLENGEKNEEREIPVSRFSDEDIDLERIYRLMMKECRRLDDGLPIYARRRDIS